jgi:ubiquinone/menaquinone biosynthesis C-methylase UbiE
MLRTFFNQQAIIWDETIAEKNPFKLKKVAQRLDIRNNHSILDVGTGTGILIPYLLNRIGTNGRLVAMDIAEEMLKVSRGKEFKGNIEYLHADITTLPMAESVFDAVVCYSSFPHFRSKPRALTEIYRVLTHGGRLYICHTSNRYTINDIHQAIEVLKNDLIPDNEEVYGMLSMAGFNDIKIEDEIDSYLASAMKP